MKKKTVLTSIVLVLCSILLCTTYSCKNIDGDCEPPKFGSTHVFGKAGGEIIIKAKNNISWTFSELYVNKELITWNNDTLKVQYEDPKIPHSIKKFESSWFVIEKINNKAISIKLKEASEPQSLSFKTFAGNCWTDIFIEQNLE